MAPTVMVTTTMTTTTILLLLLSLAVSHCTALFDGGNDAVLLQDIQALTFRRGQYTTARRSRPVPQLRCVGGDACRAYTPQVVQCTNSGFDGYDVHWRCEASMPDSFAFGTTDVTCEGFDSRDDPYVLRGSCGLEYVLNDASSHRFAGNNHDIESDSRGRASRTTVIGELMGAIVTVMVLIVAVWLLLQCATSEWNSYDDWGDHGRRGWRNASPWGHDWADWGRNGVPGRSFGTFDSWFRADDGREFRHGQRDRFRRDSWPGFWSGVGVGGLGGYFMGSSGDRHSDRYYGRRFRRGHNDHSNYNYGSGGRFDSWWNDSRSTSRTRLQTGSGYSGAESRDVIATGFGTTRRR